MTHEEKVAMVVEMLQPLPPEDIIGERFETPYVVTISNEILGWVVISQDADNWYFSRTFLSWFEDMGWEETTDYTVVACGMNQIIPNPTHYEFLFRTLEMATEFKLSFPFTS